MKRLATWVVLVLGACSVLACSADDGKPSTPIGTVFDGGADSQSDAAPDAGAGDGGKRALAEDCIGDSDCESGICFKGGKSGWCSVKCTPTNAAQVCTGIFAGDCNQQGFCRRPN